MKNQFLIIVSIFILIFFENVAKSQNIYLGSDNYIFLHSPTDMNWRFGKDGDHNINIFGYGYQNRRFRIINSANSNELFNVNLGTGFVGIGTSNQYSAMLHVNKPVIGDIGGSIFITNTATATVGNKVRLGFDLAFFDDIVATASIDAKLSNTNGSTDLIFNAYDGSGFVTNYERMRIIGSTGYIGIGTSSPAYKLDVIGTIRAREVKVDLLGADFVFDKSYNLKDLSEVKEYINKNKHLPDIESAKEMEGNGVNIGELQTKLLQKIEELTLYTIQQNDKIKALEQKLIELESKK